MYPLCVRVRGSGPTEESNWVITGRLLVGAYPGAVHDELNERILRGILERGVCTFVCLQQEYVHDNVTEEQWRAGEKLRPYIHDAVKLVDTVPAEAFYGGQRPSGLDFVHFPIVDCSTANDTSVLALARLLVKRLLAKEVMYVHCEYARRWRLFLSVAHSPRHHGVVCTVLLLSLSLSLSLVPPLHTFYGRVH